MDTALVHLPHNTPSGTQNYERPLTVCSKLYSFLRCIHYAYKCVLYFQQPHNLTGVDTRASCTTPFVSNINRCNHRNTDQYGLEYVITTITLLWTSLYHSTLTTKSTCNIFSWYMTQVCGPDTYSND